jgi:DNA gyrase subunit B
MELIELLRLAGLEDKTFLQDRAKMEGLGAFLRERGYETEEMTFDTDRGLFMMVVKPSEALLMKASLKGFSALENLPVVIGRELIYSADFQRTLGVGKKISRFDEPPFSLSSKESDKQPVVHLDKKSLFESLIEDGKKGLSIQRYKGLGEMNPEQLWETTMNPEKRNLLKVKVLDAVDSDEVFTILMGDDVEPRREFIQTNALEVNVLDI